MMWRGLYDKIVEVKRFWSLFCILHVAKMCSIVELMVFWECLTWFLWINIQWTVKRSWWNITSTFLCFQPCVKFICAFLCLRPRTPFFLFFILWLVAGMRARVSHSAPLGLVLCGDILRVTVILIGKKWRWDYCFRRISHLSQARLSFQVVCQTKSCEGTALIKLWVKRINIIRGINVFVVGSILSLSACLVWKLCALLQTTQQ